MSKTEEFLTKLEDLLTEYGGTDWEYNFQSEEDGLLFNNLWIGGGDRPILLSPMNGRTTTRFGK
tara:strand:- start:21 stop:212 length:192 start_codon:yes stop_codon:yes gene_type:complete